MFLIDFHRLEEIVGLVESVEGKPLNPGITVHHADVKLRTKFRVGVRLAPDNRLHPWLTDSDDPIRHAVSPVLMHLQLLLVERGACVQQIVYSLVKPNAFVSDEVHNVPDITANKLQLPPDAFSNGFGGTFLVPGQVQERLPRNLRKQSP